jgi:hypothetical protein
MNLTGKILFFISDFLPLIIILSIKYSYQFPSLLVGAVYFVILIVILILCAAFWKLIVRFVNVPTGRSYKVLQSKNGDALLLSYVFPYFVTLIGLNLNSIQDTIVLIFLIVLIFIIYLQSEILYFNPMLYLFRYRIYRITAQRPGFPPETSFSCLLISKRAPPLGEQIKVKELDLSVVVEED